MKLLLRRDQKTGLIGRSITFTIDVRAELSPEELDAIKKYKLGRTELFSRDRMANRGSGWLGFFWRMWFRAKNVTIKVDDLVAGKHFECKDITEMLAMENHVREAVAFFRTILLCAANFGGEEVVEF